MRRMLVSRSSLLNPNPLLRLVRTSSPSRISTRLPCACSFPITALARVDLPAPDKPVNHKVNPRCIVSVLLLPSVIYEQVQLKAVGPAQRIHAPGGKAGKDVLAGRALGMADRQQRGINKRNAWALAFPRLPRGAERDQAADINSTNRV